MASIFHKGVQMDLLLNAEVSEPRDLHCAGAASEGLRTGNSGNA